MARDPRLARETSKLTPADVLEVAGPDIPPWLRRLVWLMDDAIPVPGTDRGVGVDAVLGLVLPGVGDALTSLTTLALLVVAVRRGVPGPVLFRMIAQQAVDFGVGSVPVVGDVFDALNRANRKNLELIEQHTRGDHVVTTKDRLYVAAAVLLAIGLVVLPIVIAIGTITAIVHLLRD